MPSVPIQPVENPILLFQMQLDSNRHVIPGLNRGRLSLWEMGRAKKLIQRWVFTSSYNGKQGVFDWKKRGGLCPPQNDMPGWKMFQVPTKLIIQPGQPVDRGFLIYESSDNKACEMNTVSGTKRSEIMIHEDKNSPGSFGCLVAPTGEYKDFEEIFVGTCEQHSTVPLGVLYSW